MADADPGPMEGAAFPQAPDPALARAKWDMNDLGNARRFAVAGAGRLLFVGEIGRQGEWVWFDGQRWSLREGRARATAIAQRVVDLIIAESWALRQATPEELRDVFGPKFTAEMAASRATELYGWAMKTGNSERVGGMLKQAQGLVDGEGGFLMRASLDDFDVQPMAWHCRNGTVRFVEGPEGWEARFDAGHDPADRFMQMADAVYLAGADCPRWRDRLTVLHREPEARTAVQRIYGMTLTALTSDQAFYVYQGKGGDGKSMTNKVVGQIQGDYFRVAAPATFLQSKQQRNGAEHQADIMRLRGDIRMVVTDEPPKNSTWDGQRIKQVTGSKIVGRLPNAIEDLTYKPHWQLIVECNQLPNPPSDDRGFRRRFKLYPWVVQFGITEGVEDRPEDLVYAELIEESAGIVNWMIAGALEWLNTREVPEPELSKRALASFWANGSAMGEWLEARCDTSDPDAQVGATVLYEDFRAFCIDRGDKEEHIPTQTSFGKQMTAAQIYVGKDATGRKVRLGIRLRAEGEDRAGAAPAVEDWVPFGDDDGFPA